MTELSERTVERGGKRDPAPAGSLMLALLVMRQRDLSKRDVSKEAARRAHPPSRLLQHGQTHRGAAASDQPRRCRHALGCLKRHRPRSREPCCRGAFRRPRGRSLTEELIAGASGVVGLVPGLVGVALDWLLLRPRRGNWTKMRLV